MDYQNNVSENKEIDHGIDVFNMKKTTFWDVYGLRSYQGKGKHSVCLHRTFDGTLVLRNNLIKPLIDLFEKEFKACLVRRKQHQDFILNIRYPDKTSDLYLDYLENCDEQGENCIRVPTDDIERKLQFHNTQKSEQIIRMRQKIIKVIDLLRKRTLNHLTFITSGSLAEGLDLPGSDRDAMIVDNDVHIVQNLKKIYFPLQQLTLLMERDNQHYGFTKLKLINVYVNYMRYQYMVPCVSDKQMVQDIAFCFQLHEWPSVAKGWIYRHRPRQWPGGALIDSIINDGCLLVPIGPKYVDNELFWRISFSLAEKKLVHSFNYTQFMCYTAMKFVLKTIIDKNEATKDLLCSYFLKTALFWVSEECSKEQFQVYKISQCLKLCLNKLIVWVDKCYCPNYFIPEQNMFKGKITSSNNIELLMFLIKIRDERLENILDNFISWTIATNSVCQIATLELMFFRVNRDVIILDINDGFECLIRINNLLMSESSSFIHGICKFYHSIASQHSVQSFPLSEVLLGSDHEHCPRHKIFSYKSNKTHYYLRRKMLHDGTKSDAVSGWLFYASYYYLREQYTAALKIVDYVLSRCVPGMLSLLVSSYDSQQIINYQNIAACNNLTLNERMKLLTYSNINFVKNSALIPTELQYEVQKRSLIVPPVVMSHCLRFFCYHHLHDIYNRQQSLQDLLVTIEQRYFVVENLLSPSYTLLGICYQISGDPQSAHRCYEKALCSGGFICESAGTRLANLISNSVM
ncbi:unnamed protein product [Mytilus coruscus]|uniref:Uncharacterized protein n=1 Tax=Mytilus coruscus TaxID=42192 RepID=A0A6J8DQ31_MYTCO|nr:unnamed protein product [Mytilus coruscus]